LFFGDTMLMIQADLHTHTVASTHAYSTVSENAAYAAEIGLKAVAVTDHGCGSPDSPHIWHFDNLSVLPRKIKGVYVLRGIEANIVDDDYGLDVGEKVLGKLEWVIASLHSQTFSPADKKKNTEMYLKLCENKDIDVFGHPTTAKFPFDMEKCVKKCKEYGKFVEINESSIIHGKSPVNICVELLGLCKKYNLPVVVNTDSHFCELIGHTDTVTKMLEDLDFPKDLVFNSDWDRVREHIINKHGTIGL